MDLALPLFKRVTKNDTPMGLAVINRTFGILAAMASLDFLA
jgi:hypothetical protein